MHLPLDKVRELLLVPLKRVLVVSCTRDVSDAFFFHLHRDVAVHLQERLGGDVLLPVFIASPVFED